MPVITLQQIVAILYYILHSTGSQCKSTRRGGDMFSLGSPADKTSSTVHHTMNFVQEFLRNTYQKGITVIDTGQDKRCDKNFCGLSSKELTIDPILLISKYAVWQILSTCCFMMSPQSNMTPRLRAEQQKGISLGPILRTSGRSEDLEGSRAELPSCLHSVGACYGWSTSFHPSHSFACCRKENQYWNEKLSCTTQCHQQTCDVEQSDVQ